MIFLLKLPDRKTLCHKGYKEPIIFDNEKEAQSYLDNNEHPEDDFEMIECESRDDLLKYLRGEA